MNAGKFCETGALIHCGEGAGKAVVPFIHQGGKKHRITFMEQVFDTKNDDTDQFKVQYRALISKLRYPRTTVSRAR